MAGISIAHLVRALPLVALACLTLTVVSDTAGLTGRACSDSRPTPGPVVTATTTDASGEWFGLRDGAVATWRQAEAAGARAADVYEAARSAGCLFDDIDVPASRARW